MTDTKEQIQFTKDLIDAGYKTFKSEDENQILRNIIYHVMNLYLMIKIVYIKIIQLEMHTYYILEQKTKKLL